METKRVLNVSTHKSLIEIQKETFLELFQEIKEHRKHESPKITRYRKTYLEDVTEYESLSSKSELFEDLERARIIYCGDFHTLQRSQYSALKILRFLVAQGKKVFLGLELVPASKELLANAFVQGEVSEDTFLRKLDYEKVWGFPWANYQAFFHFARSSHVEILGLNADDPNTELHKRDKIASERIFSALKDPDAVIFCLYGDTHIAQKHIPEKVEKLFQKSGKKKPKSVTIYQNSDEIYWKLLDQKLAHQVDVVKVASHRYCILSSTPWIKWQSYQSWIDEHCGLLDEQEEEDTFGYYQTLPDFFHEIKEVSEDILQFLQENLLNFDHLHIHTALDTKVMEKIGKYFDSLDDAPKKSIQKILESEVIENRSVLIPDLGVIYLLDFSRNRAAEKAAQWVATQLSNRLCIYRCEFNEKEIFYRLILWEAIGYFGSKIINPKRKCNQYEDFRNYLEEIEGRRLNSFERDEKTIAKTVLKHHEYEVARKHTNVSSPRGVYTLEPKLFFLSARSEGRILGDYLYSRVVSDQTPLKVVKHLFTCLSSKDSVQNTYWELALQIKGPEKENPISKDELF